MAKQTAHDNIMMRPHPSARVPWLVIFLLIACIVVVYLGYLRPPDRLLGPPLPRNEYQQYLRKPKPKPKPRPALSPATPATPAPAATPGAAPR